MMDIWVNLAGILFIALVIWWFWGFKPKSVTATSSDAIDIVVEDGVYTPSNIEAKTGEPLKLNFIRRDPSPCAAQVVFESIGISADLTVDKSKRLEVTFDAAGDYDFTCQMGMYRGKVHVE